MSKHVQFLTPKVQRRLFKAFIHIAMLMPLINSYWLAINDLAGGDPVEYILHFTGIGALNVLLITLCITPLSKRFKLSVFMQCRRVVGLYSFFYALCHIVSFLAFEVQFDLSLFVGEIIERPYILVGAVASILLLLLTFTSFNKIKKQMKQRWQQLHNSIYLITLLGIWHYYWSVKSDITTPILYFLAFCFLLSLRKEKIKRMFFK
mgnify:CR=1 FL=1